MKASPDVFPSFWTPPNPCALPGWGLIQGALSMVKSHQTQRAFIDVYLLQNLTSNADSILSPSLSLSEIFPVLCCLPNFRNIHQFNSQKELTDFLHSSLLSDEVFRCEWEHFQSHSLAHPISSSAGDTNLWTEIWQYNQSHAFLPKLNAPNGCHQNAIGFRCQLGAHRIAITVDIQNPLEDAFWEDFFRKSLRQHPHLAFIVLGNPQEHVSSIFNLPNVHSPRLMGLNLGHELALISTSDVFMGRTGNHASMAIFSDTPYLLFGMDSAALASMGLPSDTVSLPGATQNQILTQSSPNAPLLQSELEKLLDATQERIEQQRFHRLQVSFPSATLVNNAGNYSKEIGALFTEKMNLASEITEKGKAPEALSQLDRLWKRFPDDADIILDFQTTRSLVLSVLGKYQEAYTAIQREIHYHPENENAQKLEQKLKTQLQSR